MLAEQRQSLDSCCETGHAPVVVVGSGPVGVRCAQELHRRRPELPLIIYSNEPWQPYNRVLLSSFLAGNTGWAALTVGLELPAAPNVETRLHCAVVAIDRERHELRDAAGRVQAYSSLILATGSRPRIPDIPGIAQANVYVFRDLNDAQRLFARRASSRCVVVLGGGLLGLEAARAMQRLNTEVWVIEHNARLMMSQLDAAASELLLTHVRAQGIRVVLGEHAVRIQGKGRVSGVSLSNRQSIACDSVIVAAGVQPNTELALQARLKIGRGIRVDDTMRSSDPDIYAIGECAEHRDTLYGLIAPGLEQAAVAVHNLCGGDAAYACSLVSTRLKLLDLPVFSIGRDGERDNLGPARQVIYTDKAKRIYRKLVVEHGRLIGCIAVGDWTDSNRIQEALTSGRRIYAWQLLRFRRSGSLWTEDTAACVADWPATALVCHCNNVTRGQLGAAIGAGCRSIQALADGTRAGTVCGSCKPLLAELLGSAAPKQPVRAHKPMLAGAVLAAMLTLAILVLPSIPYAQSVQHTFQWDVIWREVRFKQFSGFTVLGLSMLGLLLSLRKRWSWFQRGDFSIWRLLHIGVGLCVLLALLVHTGGRLGHHLNLALMLSFCGLLLAGGAGSTVIAREHQLPSALARRWRDNGVWLHILLFWPVPVLLGFHVLKSYYF